VPVQWPYIIDCVQGGSGAPTAAQIVSWVNAKPRVGTPPLQAYATVAPMGVDYLIPARASGDFLAWLGQNPQSARAKLERCIIEKYNSLDLPAALVALQADPWVDSAAEPPEWSYSAVELGARHCPRSATAARRRPSLSCGIDG
jgi:hypothetical protein